MIGRLLLLAGVGLVAAAIWLIVGSDGLVRLDGVIVLVVAVLNLWMLVRERAWR